MGAASIGVGLGWHGVGCGGAGWCWLGCSIKWSRGIECSSYGVLLVRRVPALNQEATVKGFLLQGSAFFCSRSVVFYTAHISLSICK